MVEPRNIAKYCTAISCGLLLFLPGCSRGTIDTTYGKRRGYLGAKSVNGTAVLAEMYAKAGHRVSTWRRLSPKLEGCDVIVWIPDNYEVPTPEHREFLDRWLARASNRTLVYVARDYDASLTYWGSIKPIAPSSQYMEVARRWATVHSTIDTDREAIPESSPAGWFTLKEGRNRRKVTALDGDWSNGIDASRVEMDVGAYLDVPIDTEIDDWLSEKETEFESRPDYEVLLESDGIPLVTRVTRPHWNGSQILTVANGSFLLNLPLVNHEHRKLAARLIEACGKPARVIFLESTVNGPIVFDVEPDPKRELPWPAWLVCVFQIQLVLPLIILCAVLFPIFGRPKEWERTIESDFGKHVAAYGELLELTADRQYAFERMKYYHKHIKRDSAAAQLKSSSPRDASE